MTASARPRDISHPASEGGRSHDLQHRGIVNLYRCTNRDTTNGCANERDAKPALYPR